MVQVHGLVAKSYKGGFRPTELWTQFYYPSFLADRVATSGDESLFQRKLLSQVLRDGIAFLLPEIDWQPLSGLEHDVTLAVEKDIQTILHSGWSSIIGFEAQDVDRVSAVADIQVRVDDALRLNRSSKPSAGSATKSAA